MIRIIDWSLSFTLTWAITCPLCNVGCRLKPRLQNSDSDIPPMYPYIFPSVLFSLFAHLLCTRSHLTVYIHLVDIQTSAFLHSSNSARKGRSSSQHVASCPEAHIKVLMALWCDFSKPHYFGRCTQNQHCHEKVSKRLTEEGNKGMVTLLLKKPVALTVNTLGLAGLRLGGSKTAL